ncbi:carbon-nitrogen family hydrolase [Campylobacter sp. RM12327]|uniref:carbon-nitrogen family hydrolase n=1 Tax=Campylobacter sputorum TaxID=206 RepID=UPI000B771BB8|nr:MULTISPECIES: carbon-nitrogen family hydrolase [Campylobacter]ASM39895.1 nitrilase [Campylobacter sputorum]MBE7357546.1 carbon-nitrogen family hydrolase [Campylobacter sp. RM11302]MBF6669153.1 carbon-nitrogen family hydrolase [Campylobacter sp. RM12327]MBF6674371.1 carbon-nitrogen family hydrolase [Campylobacter sp. RM13538]MBF6675412.1 carbon-nitrogen family hydrolase [Campylobacter sp. RM12321]
MKKLRICIIQTDIIMGKSDKNYHNIVNKMQHAIKDRPDVIVLPETLNLGFFPKENLYNLADKNGKKSKEIFGEFAKKYSVNIVAGSVVNLKNNKIYNTNYSFDRNGNVINEYDKIHLFTPSNEHNYFENGDKISYFYIDGVKCSCFICYDLRFPEIFRIAALNGVSIVFLPAQWPLSRKNHLQTLIKARAIENQIFMCSSSACGKLDKVILSGHSMLVNPLGDELMSFDEKENIQSYDINLDEILLVKEKMNILNDIKFKIYDKKLS